MLARQEREEILKLHRNAQRLLRPLFVVNPYARELTFLDHLTRTRRDHTKYLALIRTIALLHQHQRSIRTATHRGKTIEYIEVTPADIETANRLAHEVLGKSLDELPPQTRRLLLLVDEMVAGESQRLKMERGDYRFSRRDVRHHTGWSDAQLKRHLHKLEELEYLVVHRGGRGQSFVYELYFQQPPDPRQPFLPGLIEHGKLKTHGYDGNKYGLEAEKDASNTPQARGGCPGVVRVARSQQRQAFQAFFMKSPQKSLIRRRASVAGCTHARQVTVSRGAASPAPKARRARAACARSHGGARRAASGVDAGAKLFRRHGDDAPRHARLLPCVVP